MPVERDTIAVALVALVVGSTLGAGAVALAPPTSNDAGPNASTTADRVGPPGPSNSQRGPDSSTAGVDRFRSEAEFRNYVQRSRSGGYLRGVFGGRRVVQAGGVDGADAERGATPTPAPTRTDADRSGGAPGNEGGPRVSGTNVQETGIDEPDILKTAGQTVFYAGMASRYRHEDEGDLRDTKVIDASTPADPSVVGEVEATGRMLVSGNTLVVIGDGEITGYNVRDRENPTQVWEKTLDGRVAAARLYDGQVYLVVQKGIDPEDPCPVRPMGADGPVVECTEVYHPTRRAQAEVTYTTMRMTPGTGAVTDTVSVVGSANDAATYVSGNAVYLSYVRRASRADLTMEFLLTNQSDELDDVALARLNEIKSYNLSDRAKLYEISTVVENWFARMDADRREQAREEYAADWRAYLKQHRRELVTTGIVKVGIEGDLSVEAVGEVPGVPLNQFSMDERDGRLRIATTVSAFGRADSANDLYVLNSNLSIQGSVQGLAPGQRIYSVRFMNDTAYVVTFRQVDPFHVIDLSNPAKPEELGQVKLPGFSRYLHPIGENRVLGIGRQDGKVKAVVFDVSDPTDPRVLDSKVVDDRWSAISESHHAFLNDPKHDVFFLPGSDGGYVFSYADGLSVRKTVETDGMATRAMYIGNYMYVFGQDGLVVVDETNWERVDSVDFDERETEDDR